MNQSPFRILNLYAASALLLLLAFAAPAGGQTSPAPREGTAPGEETPAPRRAGGGLLARLNLTPEQRARIRAIRRETEREARPLLLRVRRARLALDQAIYSDTADDALVEERLREFTAAQTDAVRLRATTELRVRRVLTPEQLATLRELRRQARLARPLRQRRRQQLPAQQP